MVVGRCWALCLALLCVEEKQVTAMQEDVCLNMKNMSKFLEFLLITTDYGGRMGKKFFSHSWQHWLGKMVYLKKRRDSLA